MCKFFISGILILFTCFCNLASVPVGSFSEKRIQDLKKEIEQIVDEYKDDISGIQICVSKDNEDLLSLNFGYKDVENKISVDKETLFNLASISKLFIWIAVIQQIERGNLRLDDRIVDIFGKDYFKQDVNKDITVLNLMNHDAGFKGNKLCLERKNSLKEELPYFYSFASNRLPGENVCYSNAGANLAAVVVEVVSKKQFYDYVYEEILRPLNLEGKIFYPRNSDELQKVAYPYVGGSGAFRRTSRYGITNIYPSGSLVSSASDMNRVLEAFANTDENLLFKKRETLSFIREPSLKRTDFGIFSIFNGFWGSDGICDGIGHCGNVGGMTSRCAVNLNNKIAVTILANIEDAEGPIFRILTKVLGNKFSEIPTDVFGEESQNFDQKSNKNFPNPKLIEGNYRHLGSGKVSNVSFIPGSDNLVTVLTDNHKVVYKQIWPFLYENTSSDSKRDCGFFYKRKMYFVFNDIKNKVEKVLLASNEMVPI